MSPTPTPSTDSLIASLSTLPEEIITWISELVQTPSKPSDYLKLLPLSRKHYDKHIFGLYETVILNSGNAELFFYGLGPLFGCSIPSLEQILTLGYYSSDVSEEAGLSLDRSQRNIHTADMSDRQLEIARALPCVQYHSLTTPFSRKNALLCSAVQNVTIEDTDALMKMVEAASAVRDPPLNMCVLFGNLYTLSIGTSLIERYDQAIYAWEPVFDRMIPIAAPKHICLHFPSNSRLSNPASTCSMMVDSIKNFSDENNYAIESLTIHNVDCDALSENVDSRIFEVDTVRLFLKIYPESLLNEFENAEESEDDGFPILSKDGCDYLPGLSTDQRVMVSSDLIGLSLSANDDTLEEVHRRSNWDKPEYLNFLPCEEPNFDPMDIFRDMDCGEEVLTNPHTGRSAKFYGWKKGDPCVCCGKR